LIWINLEGFFSQKTPSFDTITRLRQIKVLLGAMSNMRSDAALASFQSDWSRRSANAPGRESDGTMTILDTLRRDHANMLQLLRTLESQRACAQFLPRPNCHGTPSSDGPPSLSIISGNT
jgi:hypothetical protein